MVASTLGSILPAHGRASPESVICGGAWRESERARVNRTMATGKEKRKRVYFSICCCCKDVGDRVVMVDCGKNYYQQDDMVFEVRKTKKSLQIEWKRESTYDPPCETRELFLYFRECPLAHTPSNSFVGGMCGSTRMFLGECNKEESERNRPDLPRESLSPHRNWPTWDESLSFPRHNIKYQTSYSSFSSRLHPPTFLPAAAHYISTRTWWCVLID